MYYISQVYKQSGLTSSVARSGTIHWMCLTSVANDLVN
jgi:hypothetical protein